METIEHTLRKLYAIKKIRKDKKKLTQLEKQVIDPVLTNIELIPKIHAMFCEIHDKKDVKRSLKQKEFIFLILLLFSPESLLWYKTKKGIRDKIAIVLNLKEPVKVSKRITEVLFQYEKYGDFRDDVNLSYHRILNDSRLCSFLKH